jgi:hypothetical protein
VRPTSASRHETVDQHSPKNKAMIANLENMTPGEILLEDYVQIECDLRNAKQLFERIAREVRPLAPVAA